MGTAAPQRYSLAHLTILDTPTPELVRIAHRTGYDYVSPRLICHGLPGDDYSLATNPTLLAQTRAALADTGIPVHDIELARIVEGLDPRVYEPEIAVGAELGATGVLTSIWVPDRLFYLDAFGRLADLVASYGMTLNLEFVPIAAVRNLAGAVDVLRETQRPNARLMIDLHHFHRSRDRVEDLDGLPPEWFEFCHLCDAPGEIPADVEKMTHILRAARSYVGEGGINPAATLAHLPPLIYSIELPNEREEVERGAEGHARRCLETAKAYFAQPAA